MFKRDAIFNLLVLGVPIFVGGILAIMLPATAKINPISVFFIVGSVLLLSGWIILVYSKWPQIKQGKINHFGFGKLPKENKRIYAISYCLLIFGFILVFSAR